MAGQYTAIKVARLVDGEGGGEKQRNYTRNNVITALLSEVETRRVESQPMRDNIILVLYLST